MDEEEEEEEEEQEKATLESKAHCLLRFPEQPRRCRGDGLGLPPVAAVSNH